MQVYHFGEEPSVGQYLMLASDLLEAPVVHTGEWQTMKTAASPAHATHELEDVSLVWDRIPQTAGGVYNIMPAIDIEWAAEHFEERVSGQPLNPAPSHVRWPYAVRGNADHTRCPTCGSPDPRTHPAVGGGGEVTSLCPDLFHSGGTAQFDHTYPERFWPKYAGDPGRYRVRVGQMNQGIRFDYGDLEDVVDLLVRNPLTRQAYLPIWFPEDTGAMDGQRVPCTLGYHFMQRNGRLSCRYYLRSCDLYRHLSNDVFFAAALTTWICNRLWAQTQDVAQVLHVRPGGLAVHISSLHAFVGDEAKIKARIEKVSL